MKFTGTIDLGDAQQIHAISGKYSLYVVLADRSLSEMIQQKVATVQIKFATETNIPQILDSSLPKIEEIYPTFYPAKPYSFIVSQSDLDQRYHGCIDCFGDSFHP